MGEERSEIVHSVKLRSAVGGIIVFLLLLLIMVAIAQRGAVYSPTQAEQPQRTQTNNLH